MGDDDVDVDVVLADALEEAEDRVLDVVEAEPLEADVDETVGVALLDVTRLEAAELVEDGDAEEVVEVSEETTDVNSFAPNTPLFLFAVPNDFFR